MMRNKSSALLYFEAQTMQALLTNDQAAVLFDSLLFDTCGIHAEEAGMTHADVMQVAMRCKSRLQVKHAVLAFAADYDFPVKDEQHRSSAS
jgi:hypothetical protein